MPLAKSKSLDKSAWTEEWGEMKTTLTDT